MELLPFLCSLKKALLYRRNILYEGFVNVHNLSGKTCLNFDWKILHGCLNENKSYTRVNKQILYKSFFILDFTLTIIFIKLSITNFHHNLSKLALNTCFSVHVLNDFLMQRYKIQKNYALWKFDDILNFLKRWSDEKSESLREHETRTRKARVCIRVS